MLKWHAVAPALSITERMELRQLQYFIAVAEQLNFSTAAKSLCITQSTLSQQIKQLEEELGVRLLERNSHEVVLTEPGEAFLPNARRTIDDAETSKLYIRDLQHLKTGVLNVGVTYSFHPIMTETVLTFMRRFPAIRLNIFYKRMEDLLEDLQKRQVDFVLSYKPLHALPSIKSRELFRTQLAAITAVDHPLAGQKSVTLKELAQCDLALPTNGLQARNFFNRFAEKSDLHFNVRFQLNVVHMLLDLVGRSRLVSVLSASTVKGHQDVVAIPIDLPENEMIGCIHTLEGAYEKNAAKEFLQLLRQQNDLQEMVNSM